MYSCSYQIVAYAVNYDGVFMGPTQGPYILQLCMGPSYFWGGSDPSWPPPLFRTLAIKVDLADFSVTRNWPVTTLCGSNLIMRLLLSSIVYTSVVFQFHFSKAGAILGPSNKKVRGPRLPGPPGSDAYGYYSYKVRVHFYRHRYIVSLSLSIGLPSFYHVSATSYFQSTGPRRPIGLCLGARCPDASYYCKCL